MAFVTPISVDELCAAEPAAKSATIRRFVSFAQDIGILRRADDPTTERRDALRYWEAHDLLFHITSRTGATRGAIGATYRFGRSQCIEPPVRAEDPQSVSISLNIPSTSSEISLLGALETRRTRYDQGPLLLEELSTFLYQTCRILEYRATQGEETVRKVYPSGGSRHPLEVYPIVYRCPSLAAGIYRYDPLNHKLSLVRPWDDSVAGTFADAGAAVGRPDHRPAVLIVVSARFARTAWKYQAIAYRLMLIELGTLFQTMYLVATAMGLSPCALGTGNSVRFAELIGTDEFAESSIGEFMLSGRVGEG
jgi:SagB-type dehydrogenase family enzyme